MSDFLQELERARAELGYDERWKKKKSEPCKTCYRTAQASQNGSDKKLSGMRSGIHPTVPESRER